MKFDPDYSRLEMRLPFLMKSSYLFFYREYNWREKNRKVEKKNRGNYLK
jgi:hypothetical protein